MKTTKGPFIATQLNSTRRRVELCRYKRALTYTKLHLTKLKLGSGRLLRHLVMKQIWPILQLLRTG